MGVEAAETTAACRSNAVREERVKIWNDKENSETIFEERTKWRRTHERFLSRASLTTKERVYWEEMTIEVCKQSPPHNKRKSVSKVVDNPGLQTIALYCSHSCGVEEKTAKQKEEDEENPLNNCAPHIFLSAPLSCARFSTSFSAIINAGSTSRTHQASFPPTLRPHCMFHSPHARTAQTRVICCSPRRKRRKMNQVGRRHPSARFTSGVFNYFAPRRTFLCPEQRKTTKHRHLSLDY